MESKLILQMDNYNKIIKARLNFKKSPKERITVSYVEVRLEALERLWLDFAKNHQDLIVQFGAKLQGGEYLEKDIYDQTEELYIEYKTELRSLLSSNNTKSSDNTASVDHSQNVKKTVDLPKIIIPSFSGKYTEWVTFRDMFLSVIHNNCQLGNVQKMHYLKSYLTGEAEQLLRQIPISDANYERCWTQLEARYNNKRYLSHFIIKKLLSQRNITVESANNLKELMDTTNDCLSGLQNLGVKTDNWDIIVIHILSLKLDPESRKQWEFKVTSNTSSEELPTYVQFSDFLTQRYRALEFLDPKSVTLKPPANQNVNNNSVHKAKSLHVSNISCTFCSEAHKLSACKKFVKQNVDQRRNFVQSNNVCYNCLGTNHGAKTCLSSTKCRLCHRRHHTLLHPRSADILDTTNLQAKQDTRSGLLLESEPSKAGEIAENSANSTSLVSCFSTGKVLKQVLLATALVKAESKNGHSHTLRALLDQGSQASFVTEATVQNLKLKKLQVKSKISGLGENQGLISNTMVELKLKSRFNANVLLTVKAHVLKSITTFLPEMKVNVLDWPELESIELADPQYYQPNKIDILLGADVYSRIISEGLKRGPNGSLVAQSTNLGWILSGVVGSAGNSRDVLVYHNQIQVQDEDDLLKQFWELESDLASSRAHIFTEEERRCEEFFCKTTTRDADGRYIVRLPFKVDDPDCKCGETRFVAANRLKGLERRLRKDEKLNGKYKEVIEEYEELGHAMIVQEPDENKHKAVYLPHHAVVREDKDTSKVRVVFNASSSGRNGVTLNDCLMVGPTIQPDLRHLVLKWRLNKICITADIVKMYRQVKVHEDDTDFQRFLWRKSPEEDIIDYKLLRVTFGTACAPFLAVRALQQLALDEGGAYPQAKERVLSEFYMDDLMSGCETVSEGIEICRQMNELLKKGGFTLQKWMSNDDKLLEQIKEKGEEVKEGLKIKMDKIVKVLGLTWERHEDHLRYAVELKELEQPVTKRKIIAEIARLFDPLGWITPCIITAKVMIQKLWVAGVEWDEKVPSSILNEWYTYRTGLLELANVAVPRWVKTQSDDAQRELHGFCDASKVAYAAVVYLRVIDSEGNIHVSLITAKSKVAPIKQVSIPRLELLGAVMLAKLLVEVAEILGIDKYNLHGWTDSTIVLAWLNSMPIKWKVFVANRVSEILTSFNPKQWSHISSKQNPADCASRGISAVDLKHNSSWFDGPEFLRCHQINYGKPSETTTDLEAINAHHLIAEQDIWEKFSTFSRLIRVVAYCRRWLFRKGAPEKQRTGYLKTEELNEALDICIRRCQWQYFEEEITAIKRKEEIKKKSVIRTLNPYLDVKNIMRVGGRLERSPLEKGRKHPIILPKKAYFTSLIVADGHRQTLHGGVQLTLNYVGAKYCILGAKQLVKAHVRKCVVCVKNRGLTYNPMMGQLPSVRVTPSRPFRCSGVDFAGPIQIRTAKGRGHKSYKGYLCLFICMATRAVHVEAVSDLTSEGFLQAFKRFTARRGHCQEVWSDNGTNFVGAAGELKKLFCAEKSNILPELAEGLANNGTSWHFIPPHAPNFGGLWEAGIKSVKHHLKRVIGNSTLTYEELATVLAQIEACLNSRPLSRLESDPAIIEVLTPGHFLVGEALLSPPDYNFENSNISSLKRWQYTQRMYQDFWRTWSREYLSQFFRRYKWSTPSPQPKTGDVVLIKEDGLPPCRWLYGLVTEEHPGQDGITRVVTIKTKNSNIKRAASKLCILPVAD